MKLKQDPEFILSHCTEIPLKRTYWLGTTSGALKEGIENLPPPSFSLVIEASDTVVSGQTVALFNSLIEEGLGYFISFGPKSEQLHDRFDWANLDFYGYSEPLRDDQHVMSIWTETFEEALDDSELIGGQTISDAEILDVVVLLEDWKPNSAH